MQLLRICCAFAAAALAGCSGTGTGTGAFDASAASADASALVADADTAADSGGAPPDAGSVDAGLLDAGATDSGAADAAGLDAGSADSGRQYVLPADRVTQWAPGLSAVGGIPNRTAICRTLSPLPNGADNTQAIQDALDTCPDDSVVQLGPGTFSIGGVDTGWSGLLHVPSHKVLRGSGATQTELAARPGGPFSQLNGGVGILLSSRGAETPWVDLAVDAVKGTRTVTLASLPAGLTAGMSVHVDQIDDMSLVDYGDHVDDADWNYSRTGRSIGQVNRVTNVAGTTLTVEAPWHIGFRRSQAAQLRAFEAAEWAGVEDLHIRASQHNITLDGCQYCWVKNVDSGESAGPNLELLATWRSEVRGSYVHDTLDPNPGGGGYGIALGWAASDNLIEDNVSIRFNKVMVMRAAGGGNVIAYNYMDDGYIAYDPEWVETGLNASHDKCTVYTLFEGNDGFNFGGDSTWGNAAYVTVFRNRLTARRSATPPLDAYTFDAGGQRLYYEDRAAACAISLMHGHKHYNFVANVLGTEGQTLPAIRSFGGPQYSGWCYDANVDCSESVGFPMWNLGWYPGSNAIDPEAAATAIRDGNFDFVTSSVSWHGLGGARSTAAPAASTMPSSLYLSSKPAFFGANPWPWVQADGAVKTHVLPARARYEAGRPVAP